MKYATLTQILETPFPQNFLTDTLRRDITAAEVPLDFLDGLQAILPKLVKDSARAERIIRLRYENGLSLAQIGEDIGVNTERIRVIIRNVQLKLYHGYRTFLCEGFAAWQAEIEAANKPLSSPEQVDMMYLFDRNVVSVSQVIEMRKIGLHTLADLQNAPDSKLLEVFGVGPWHLQRIRNVQRKLEELLKDGNLAPRL